MSKGPGFAAPSCWSVQLKRPQSGASNMIQPRVDAIEGKMNASQNTNSSPRENGMFVRASASAIATATGKLMTVTDDQIVSEFPMDERSPGIASEACQFPRPHSNGGTRTVGAWLDESNQRSRNGAKRYHAGTKREDAHGEEEDPV